MRRELPSLNESTLRSKQRNRRSMMKSVHIEKSVGREAKKLIHGVQLARIDQHTNGRAASFEIVMSHEAKPLVVRLLQRPFVFVDHTLKCVARALDAQFNGTVRVALGWQLRFDQAAEQSVLKWLAREPPARNLKHVTGRDDKTHFSSYESFCFFVTDSGGSCSAAVAARGLVEPVAMTLSSAMSTR